MVGLADLDSWVVELDDLFARVAGRFGRVESCRQARAFLTGLLAQQRQAANAAAGLAYRAVTVRR